MTEEKYVLNFNIIFKLFLLYYFIPDISKQMLWHVVFKILIEFRRYFN